MAFHEAYVVRDGVMYFADDSGDFLRLTPGPRGVAEYDSEEGALEDVADYGRGQVLVGRFDDGTLVATYRQQYAVRRVDDGKLLADERLTHKVYTMSVRLAKKFPTRQAAESAGCANTRVVAVRGLKVVV